MTTRTGPHTHSVGPLEGPDSHPSFQLPLPPRLHAALHISGSCTLQVCLLHQPRSDSPPGTEEGSGGGRVHDTGQMRRVKGHRSLPDAALTSLPLHVSTIPGLHVPPRGRPWSSTPAVMTYGFRVIVISLSLDRTPTVPPRSTPMPLSVWISLSTGTRLSSF